jgi:hypothetical protein
MATDYGRFGITVPDDTDSPNLPAQARTMSDDYQARLGYAGAQGGKSIIAGEQTLHAPTLGAWTSFGTPDRVQNLVIENDGDLLAVNFSALWKVAGSFLAAILLTNHTGPTTTQLKQISGAGAPTVQKDANGATSDYEWLYTKEFPTSGV